MRGRKPLPSSVKKRNGTYRPDRAPRNEPKPAGELVDVPAGLSAQQQEVWREAIGSAPPGLLRRLDAELFRTWVVTTAAIQAAAEILGRDGPVTFDEFGVGKTHPAVGVIAKLGALQSRLAAEMGFTPTSRARVELINDDHDVDAGGFAQFATDYQTPMAKILNSSGLPERLT